MNYRPRIGARVRTKTRSATGCFQRVIHGIVVSHCDYREDLVEVMFEGQNGMTLMYDYRSLYLELMETLKGAKRVK